MNDVENNENIAENNGENNVDSVSDSSSDEGVSSVTSSSVILEESVTQTIVNGINYQSFAISVVLGLLVVGLFFKGANN